MKENEQSGPVDQTEIAAVDREFCRQEFSALREEIIINSEEKRRLERFCLIGAAVVFSWVATEGPKSGVNSNVHFAAFVPSILVAFGWLKCVALEATIGKLGKYIYSQEKKLSPEGKGWEHFYAIESGKRRISPEKVSSFFWPLLMIATLVGAVILSMDSKIGHLMFGS